MALPVPGNTTCDVYRSSNSPPAAPDAAGVRIFLCEDVAEGARAKSIPAAVWTHIALLDLSADVRHDPMTPFSPSDSIWVPDQNGTQFNVMLVVRVGRGTDQDH